jgi:hypothetical protein
MRVALLDAGADLAQLGRLLIDPDVDTGPPQRERRGQASDTRADDDDPHRGLEILADSLRRGVNVFPGRSLGRSP